MEAHLIVGVTRHATGNNIAAVLKDCCIIIYIYPSSPESACRCRFVKVMIKS
jgi:hypothetical protein